MAEDPIPTETAEDFPDPPTDFIVAARWILISRSCGLALGRNAISYCPVDQPVQYSASRPTV